MKRICTAFVVIFVAAVPAILQAQFVHFQMNVEPELSAEVVQNIDFGEFITNSGLQRIEKGSPSMGIFEIRGLQSQNVSVTLDPPEKLIHTNPDIEQQIPVSLEAAYTSNNTQDINQADDFIGNNAWFTIGEDTRINRNQSWQSAFVYIYGTLNIGDVPEGTYEATLLLTVEYQ
jgi:hypothetical protein